MKKIFVILGLLWLCSWGFIIIPNPSFFEPISFAFLIPIIVSPFLLYYIFKKIYYNENCKMAEGKEFNKWYNTLLILCIISFFVPYLMSIILTIFVIIKGKKFIQYFNSSDRIFDIDSYCIEKEKELENLKSNIERLKIKKNSLLTEVNGLSENILAEYINTDVDENIQSEEYKNRLTIIKLKLKELVKNGKAIEVLEAQRGKKAINDNSKQILKCFEAESALIIQNVSKSNITNKRNKLQSAYENINKIFVIDGIKLTLDYFKLKLDELNTTYYYYYKKELEKEQQKAIKEQMIEEEKVRKEIEREKAKIEKEEKQFKNEVSKLMTYLQKASDIEKQLYIDKIKELEDKIKQLEIDKKDVLNRENNTRAGFVYVISNIGSFGENIYKIGMTRRLEPMDRIKELSSASVPFEFDVHAMIFSDDAPTLESILHNTFNDKRVNKVNTRKEFFNVSLSEIEKVVKENHNATVEFTEIAKAEQYRESLTYREI